MSSPITVTYFFYYYLMFIYKILYDIFVVLNHFNLAVENVDIFHCRELRIRSGLCVVTYLRLTSNFEN